MIGKHQCKQAHNTGLKEAIGIGHTMAHTRQIWLLRGALGLTDGTLWPQQH